MRISKSITFAVAVLGAGAASTAWSAPSGNGSSKEIAALQADVSALQSQVSTLQALLAGVTRLTDPATSKDTLRFSAMNVQVVNGTGSTESVNGLGNLVVGYNEADPDATNDRSGSHVIVVGKFNQYSNYIGVVAGGSNRLSANYAFVNGVANEATGLGACVSGGLFNSAQGPYSSVSGGIENTASGFYCSITGGQENSVDGGSLAATVCGGALNFASGFWSTVGGGLSRTASGDDDWVAGSLFEDD